MNCPSTLAVCVQANIAFDVNSVPWPGLSRYLRFPVDVLPLRSTAPRRSPFKRHRFPRGVIFCAPRWYLRFPLSYQDVMDVLAERGVTVDRSTVYR